MSEQAVTEKKKQFRAIRGTRDILPQDSALWNWFERTARETFESFNFRDIRVPIFEETSLFARAVGTETDVVNKEMYSFEDARGDLFLLREQIRNYVISDLNLSAESYGSINLFVRLLHALVEKLDSAIASGEVERDENAQLSYATFLNGVAHFQNTRVEAGTSKRLRGYLDT